MKYVHQQLIAAYHSQHEKERVMVKEGELNITKTQKDIREMNRNIQEIDQSNKTFQVN